MKSHNSNFLQTPNVAKNHLNSKMATLYIILITLQFYLLPLVSFLFGTDFSRYATYMHFYAMSSYTIIVIGIIVLHINGVVLFQDYFTLSIIVLSCFLRSTLKGDYELVHRIYMNFLGFVLLIYMIANQRKITMPGLKSIFIGCLWSVGTVLVLAILYVVLDPVHGSLPSDLHNYIVNMSVFQLSFVAVIEETVFRGLLFGFMVLSGCKENTALLIQAVLFWGFHYMDITKPILFFIFVPLFTISATLMVKKYKMLYLSIVMHILVNVFARIFVAIL